MEASRRRLWLKRALIAGAVVLLVIWLVLLVRVLLALLSGPPPA